jgi:hypothetical protein
MKQVTVFLENYNQDALEKGLGVKLSDLTQEQLTKILSHALGYVDYTDESIANELKELAGIQENECFFERYKAGKVEFEVIHDYIEEWHNSDSNKELHEYLGLTWEQYAKFVEDEESFEANLKGERNA